MSIDRGVCAILGFTVNRRAIFAQQKITELSCEHYNTIDKTKEFCPNCGKKISKPTEKVIEVINPKLKGKIDFIDENTEPMGYGESFGTLWTGSSDSVNHLEICLYATQSSVDYGIEELLFAGIYVGNVFEDSGQTTANVDRILELGKGCREAVGRFLKKNGILYNRRTWGLHMMFEVY